MNGVDQMKESLHTDGREAGLFHDIENVVISTVDWLRLALEVIGTLVIAIGALLAVCLFLRALWLHQGGGFHNVRLTFARYLSLALEFQLGADILSTVVAPSWDQIGKLAAIAVIRTALNYFLMYEMSIEKEATKSNLPDGRPPPAS